MKITEKQAETILEAMSALFIADQLVPAEEELCEEIIDRWPIFGNNYSAIIP